MSATRKALTATALALAGLVWIVGGAQAQGDGRRERPSRGERLPEDLAELQGTWRVVDYVMNGARVAQDPPVTLEIRGRTFRGYQGGRLIVRGEIRLKPSQSPKALDLDYAPAGEWPGGLYRGIYRLHRDTFRVCLPKVGERRPRYFSTDPTPGSGEQLVVYRRVRE